MHCRYGLGEFVLITPDEGVESLTSQAQAKLMLSSISVALANTGWYETLNVCDSCINPSLSLAQRPSLFKSTLDGVRCTLEFVKGEG